MRDRIVKITESVGLLIFLTGLFLFAYLGRYNRYYADDWCYNADLKNLGFLGTMKGYTYITTYASNRFSLTFFSGFLYQLGVFGVQAMTPLFILFWLIGLSWILSNVNKMADLRMPRFVILLIAAVVVYFSIDLAPHLYQSLYWRSGLLPYTAPIAFGVLTFGWVTAQNKTLQMHPWMLIAGSSVTAFLAGGFSEAGAAVLVTFLALYILGAWFYRQKPWVGWSLPAAGAALFSAILAMALLIFSPTSGHRLGLYGDPASLWRLPALVIGFTADFITLSVTSTPLPYAGIVLTLFCLGFFLYPYVQRGISARGWLIGSTVLAALAFITLAACFAPSAYIEQAPPAARTRIIAVFELLLFLSAIVLLTGYFVGQQKQAAHLFTVMVFLIAIAYAYDLRSAFVTAGKIPTYALRAEIWDARDGIIRQAQAQGLHEVDVKGIDGLPIGGLRDLKDKPGPGYWINICAENYYGIETIYANQP